MVEIKHLCLCLLFSSTHFSVYKDTFAFYKDTKCVQGHAILMPGFVASNSCPQISQPVCKFVVQTKYGAENIFFCYQTIRNQLFKSVWLQTMDGFRNCIRCMLDLFDVWQFAIET